MPEQNVLLYCRMSSAHSESIKTSFVSTVVKQREELSEALTSEKYQICVLDLLLEPSELIAETILSLLDPQTVSIPVVVLVGDMVLSHKIEIYNLGVDDLIENDISSVELIARCRKAIYHKLAVQQLASRLDDAQKSVQNVLVQQDELDSTLDFLMDINVCDNLDQLGQQFFSYIESHSLHCSLQMRSIISVKNMEPTGMAKDFVSQLLTQLKNDGQFLDLGRRMIVNYQRVSLLIKNMPDSDKLRYDFIKKNAIFWAKGINTKIFSLEDKYILEQERKAFEVIISNIDLVIDSLKVSYTKFLDDINENTEITKISLRNKLKKLHISEADKKDIHDLIMSYLEDMPDFVSKSLNIHEVCESLKSAIHSAVKRKTEFNMKELMAD